MIEEHFPLVSRADKTVFFFETSTETSSIVRQIIFTERIDGSWNLSFGVWRRGEKLDDSAITNDFKIRAVIGTVAKAVYEFLEKHPSRRVVILPIDEKRKVLYNRVFRLKIDQIEPFFDVSGYRGFEKTAYDPRRFFDSFELKLRFGT